MSQYRRNTLALVAALALGITSGALAQAQLVASTPASHAQVKAASSISLSFSAPIQPQGSGAKLVMTEMPGMTMDPMSVDVKTAVSADGKSMQVTPAQALDSGTYRVDWTAVSKDAHTSTGSLSFTVK